MKSYVHSSFAVLFCESDKNIEIKKIEDEDEVYDEEKVYYRTSVGTLKQRLDILGYNIPTLKYIFEESKHRRIDDFEDVDDDTSYDYDEPVFESKKDYKNFIDSFNFETYLIKLNSLYKNKIPLFFDEIFKEQTKQKLSSDNYLKFLVSEYHQDDYFLGLYNCDYRYALRGLLEKINKNTIVELDISSLVYSGYYSNDEKLTDKSLDVNSKTIIFTEGKYDTDIIKRCLGLLYPEYFDYFSFLDLDSIKIELNASRIVTYLKSFISAGITNKVIMIFDNDTEGNYFKQELNKIAIPNNFCVKSYPDINFANNYLCMGPNGLENSNVNGKACSIEMYLPKEVLTTDKKEVRPIRWKNYNEKLKQYHGGYSDNDKSIIQKEFEKILSNCEQGKNEISDYDFSNIKALLDTIIEAFNDVKFSVNGISISLVK